MTRSEVVVAPTVMADGTRAGLYRQASSPSLPAATTTTTPSAIRRSTASSSNGLASAPESLVPKLMIATAGVVPVWSSITHSIASTTAMSVPPPVQPSSYTVKCAGSNGGNVRAVPGGDRGGAVIESGGDVTDEGPVGVVVVAPVRDASRELLVGAPNTGIEHVDPGARSLAVIGVSRVEWQEGLVDSVEAPIRRVLLDCCRTHGANGVDCDDPVEAGQEVGGAGIDSRDESRAGALKAMSDVHVAAREPSADRVQRLGVLGPNHSGDGWARSRCRSSANADGSDRWECDGQDRDCRAGRRSTW